MHPPNLPAPGSQGRERTPPQAGVPCTTGICWLPANGIGGGGMGGHSSIQFFDKKFHMYRVFTCLYIDKKEK
jgi:hypothetical protein